MKTKLSNMVILVLSMLTLYSCSDLDDNEEIGKPDIENLIQKESELFELLERVAETEREDEITCINFIYSFTMLEFNSDLDMVAEYIISSDGEFSLILGSIADGNVIGINFPIQSILESGEEFLIENKDELKEAIDNCIVLEQEEMIGECSNLLQECVWIVNHNDETEDAYENAVFDVANDGTFVFYNNGEMYEGTWIVYFIEDELHTNITFDEVGVTADDWNFDWKTVIVSEDEMIFTNAAITFTLRKECDEENYCTTLTFSECEQEEDSGITEFVFQNYIDCILQIEDLEALAIDDSITFYETILDAETEINPLPQDSFYNTVEEQTIYVRVNYDITETFYIIPITIKAIHC